MSGSSQARLLRVFGIVQGVGFRPFVYRLADRYGLAGWVRNTSGDVAIHLEGPEEALDSFQEALQREKPPLAWIERVEIAPAEVTGVSGFSIDASEVHGGDFQPVSPDVATCSDCLAELFDPRDRRYLYPFTNCTNCGPRFTIIESVPYDRPSTTMKGFALCEACAFEYSDPADRRFHAQPIACPDCGPHLWLEVDGRTTGQRDSGAVQEAVRLLQSGKVVAIKGLGGFQLVVDASSGAAVSLLRRRKLRPHKPLAVMMADLEMVRRYCLVGDTAATLLTSAASPIVLLPLRQDAALLAHELAPDHDTLGVMLPYTPLHHMLMRAAGGPVVMTSGNLSEEPLAIENEEARLRLGTIADAFLMHDRPIHTPVDDSVVAVIHAEDGDGPQMVRRARGYTPSPLRLAVPGPQILATGPELKATVCVARGEFAFLSQHIGDLENVETWEHYKRIVAHMQALFSVRPEVVAHDLHPDYLSTRFALDMASEDGVPAVAVQHHWAHALACLTDNGLDPARPILAVVFDGTGYGSDGRIWGGEWLLLAGPRFERLAHLDYMPLAGGESGIKHVDRLAAGYLVAAGGRHLIERLPAFAELPDGWLKLVEASLRLPTTVLTSSAGRLFDAVAGTIGICAEATYEAQAAIRLETLARRANSACGKDHYPWENAADGAVSLGPLLLAVGEDVLSGRPAVEIAGRFHGTLAAIVAGVCAEQAARTGVKEVLLSGGCFQNTLLTELCIQSLGGVGLRAFVHRDVPCNDGGIALGQALAARLSTSA